MKWFGAFVLCAMVVGCGSAPSGGDAGSDDRDLVFGPPGSGSVRLDQDDDASSPELELDASSPELGGDASTNPDASSPDDPELELDASSPELGGDASTNPDASSPEPDAAEPDCEGWKCWVQ